MRLACPGQEDYYKDRDFDLIKLVMFLPWSSFRDHEPDHSAAFGVYYVVQTMTGHWPSVTTTPSTLRETAFPTIS